MSDFQNEPQNVAQDVRNYIKNQKQIAELQQANAKIAKKISDAHKNNPLIFSQYKTTGTKLGLDIAENERVELDFENQGEKIAFLDRLPPQYKTTTTTINSRYISQQQKINAKLRELIEKHKGQVKKNVFLELLVR